MRSQKNTVIRNSNIAWQKMQEKIVLVSPQTMRIHILHGSGGSIWEYLKEARSEDELASMVCEEYDTTIEGAQKDIRSFLTKLKKEDLIVSNN